MGRGGCGAAPHAGKTRARWHLRTDPRAAGYRPSCRCLLDHRALCPGHALPLGPPPSVGTSGAAMACYSWTSGCRTLQRGLATAGCERAVLSCERQPTDRHRSRVNRPRGQKSGTFPAVRQGTARIRPFGLSRQASSTVRPPMTSRRHCGSGPSASENNASGSSACQTAKVAAAPGANPSSGWRPAASQPPWV